MIRRALVTVLPALIALSCAGAEPEADPLARCAEDLEACYAACPRPTWMLMASAPGHLCATGRAAPGGRQHSRAIDGARERLAGSVERLGRALARPLADALAPTLNSSATAGVSEAAEAVARQLVADATLTSRVTQVYEDCVTGEVIVLVSMDPEVLVNAALKTLADLGRESGLFLIGREAAALEAARRVLESRLKPDEPRPAEAP